MLTNFCIIKHEVKKKESSSRECTTPINPYPFNLITKVCKFVLDLGLEYYSNVILLIKACFVKGAYDITVFVI